MYSFFGVQEYSGVNSFNFIMNNKANSLFVNRKVLWDSLTTNLDRHQSIFIIVKAM